MVTSTILGPDGRPIHIHELVEPQTALLQSLHHEWQGHPSRGLTPSKLATIMDAAEQGDTIAQCELFEDMEEKDAHIMAEMGKRRRAITMLEWDIVAPSSPTATEKRAAAKIKDWLCNIDDFEDALFDLTDAVGKGFVCLEMTWARHDGVWLPDSIIHRPQDWFLLRRGGYREEIRLRHGGGDGEALNPAGWLTHVHKAKSGWLSRAALFRVLAWPYLFKNYSVADLAEFLEIYGLPLRVGKYPPGASDKEKMTLLRALTGLGHKAAGIIPEGMMIDFQPATDGKPDAYQCMIDWCERSQSKAILGGTLTSQADGKTSTNALGNVHNEVRKDLRDADVKQLAATLTRDLLYPIAAINGLAPNGPRRAPRWHSATEDTEDIKTYADAMPKLVSMGMRIPRQWAQERLGIPEPDTGDEDILGLQPVAEPEPTDAAKAAARSQARGTALRVAPDADDADPPELMANPLDDHLQPSTDAWINAIRELVENADSLEQVRDGVLALMPDMSLDQYGAAMQEALAAAALAGRYEVLNESGLA